MVLCLPQYLWYFVCLVLLLHQIHYYEQKNNQFYHLYSFPCPKRPSYQSRYLTYAKYLHTDHIDRNHS